MKKEVYVMGEESRMVVKNFLQELKAAGCEPTVIRPEPETLQGLPDSPFQLIVCLEEKMDFRIIEDVADKQKKSGLSLYLIGSMGNLSLENEQFLKQLPCARFASYTIDMPVLTKLLESNASEKKRILVVDDEPILLRSVKGWLGDEFEVSLVNSGEMALEFLDMHPVDLVLLDYRMPTMDGPEVLRKIREDAHFQNLPVIFLTASNDKESVMSVMHLKPNGYLLKTMAPEEIKKAVRDFFGNRTFVFS